MIKWLRRLFNNYSECLDTDVSENYMYYMYSALSPKDWAMFLYLLNKRNL